MEPETNFPLISYAQHGEDVVLARALDGRTGFYVDVGAYDPTDDSVTRLFYERGWRGVNIDPSAEAMARFDAERPRDLNLAVAAGAVDGDTTFHVSDVPGWSTTSESAAEALRGQEHVAREVIVRVRRLSSILDELPGDTSVDFLKIDVEGSEVDVVAGLDLDRHRPRVVVLEAVSPGAGPEHVEPALVVLESAGYQRAGFDGLNHYLTCEPALAPLLRAPANPTDGYVKFTVAQVEARTSWLDEVVRERDRAIAGRDRLLDEQSTELAVLEAKLAELEAKLDAASESLRLVLASRSWRITRPLREGLRGVGVPRPVGAHQVLSSIDGRLQRHPAVRARLGALLSRHPRVVVLLQLARSRHDVGAGTAPWHDVVAARRAQAVAALGQRARRRLGAP